MTLSNRLALGITKFLDLLYLDIFKKIIPRHTFRYGVCGVVNSIFLDTIFYYIIYNIILHKHEINLGFYTLAPQIAAFILVFPITFFIGFWLNRNVAFHATSEQKKVQVSRYAISVCGSIVLS